MIRSALEEQNCANDTIIIFTSDNGFMCGSHGYGSKVLPYEEASRVPLIVMDPRSEADNLGADNKGRRCGALCGNVDIAPTILRFAGINIPDELDGASLDSLVGNSAASVHDCLPLINVWGPSAVHSLAITTKDWKYIYWPYSKNGFVPSEELYHTANDPLELTNCSQDPTFADVLRQMHGLYDEQLSRWRRTAVDYHGYKQDGNRFVRRFQGQGDGRYVVRPTQASSRSKAASEPTGN
jgi:arylsulfatase A-like enzyme